MILYTALGYHIEISVIDNRTGNIAGKTVTTQVGIVPTQSQRE